MTAQPEKQGGWEEGEARRHDPEEDRGNNQRGNNQQGNGRQDGLYDIQKIDQQKHWKDKYSRPSSYFAQSA